MVEHREAARRRVLKAGKILLDGGGAIDCTVRNLSRSGAALEVVTPIGVPDHFGLMIEAGPLLACEVVRRTERRIGIRFSNPLSGPNSSKAGD